MKEALCLIFLSTCLCSAQNCLPTQMGEFCSLTPTGQANHLELPEGYRFQLLFREGMIYTENGDPVPGRNDFAGFIPTGEDSEAGHLSVNHEENPGGVSMLRVGYDNGTRLWTVEDSRPVDFTRVGGTGGNCSGGVTPWGTILTAEESFSHTDNNGDGYLDLGWITEIDPASGRVVNEEKCWALGHLKHENATVLRDERTVYFGEDGQSSGVFKFIADRPRDLSSGALFGLVLDGPLNGREPTVATGRWVRIPNNTRAERNAVSTKATALGVTNFDGVEDVEYHPATGQIYFAAKGASRVYRFTDRGDTVGDVETYVGGREYTVETEGGNERVAWGTGNDNLIFDGAGNLWVLQDGSDNYIWVVRPDHNQATPDVAIFARSPFGSELTGLNFTPDFRFGFLSVQHPGSNNIAQADAMGNEVRFTASATIVFAPAQYLGKEFDDTEDFVQEIANLSVFPNPTRGEVSIDFGVTEAGAGYELALYDLYGRRLALERDQVYVPAGGGLSRIDLSASVAGDQFVILVILKGGQRVMRKIWVKR